MRLHYDYLDTPVGRMTLLAEGDALVQIDLPESRHPLHIEPDWIRDSAALAGAKQQLTAYFSGARMHFELVLQPRGTPFQREVWNALCDIPYGETISYAELARRIDRPKASRAVGLANGANPLSIIVPCHRVIGANGHLTGYGGGLPAKRFLLDLERRHAPVPAFQLQSR